MKFAAAIVRRHIGKGAGILLLGLFFFVRFTLFNPNTAVTAATNFDNRDYDWQKRHESLMAEKVANPPDVVLIGDSITHSWNAQSSSFRAAFGNRRVLNLGFGWDRTQNVLKRIQLGELDDIHPSVVVILIGTNNTVTTPNVRANTPSEIAEGVARIREGVRDKCPDAKIVLMAIFPRGEHPEDPKREVIRQVNQHLAVLASTQGLIFLDLTSKFLQADGSISKEVMPDFLHLSEIGYGIWAEALRSVIF